MQGGHFRRLSEQIEEKLDRSILRACKHEEGHSRPIGDLRNAQRQVEAVTQERIHAPREGHVSLAIEAPA